MFSSSSLSSAKPAQRRTSAATSANGMSPRIGDVGDDLLGQHVERVAQEARRLDLPVDHPAHDDGGLEQVAAVLGVDRALAGLADRVAGATDALQPTADRARRLDLDDQIDRAHVDAQLEAAGGDDAAQRPALQLVLDDHPLLARQRAVVGLDQLAGRAQPRLRVDADAPLGGQLVEPRGQPLGLAAAVAEDDGAAVLEHLLEDARVDAGPDDARRGAPPAPPWPGQLSELGPLSAAAPADRSAHVLDGDDDIDLQRLADAGVDDGDRTRLTRRRCPPRKWATSSSGRWVADSPMRCGGRRDDLLQPLERQRRGGRRAWWGPARGSRR